MNHNSKECRLLNEDKNIEHLSLNVLTQGQNESNKISNISDSEQISIEETNLSSDTLTTSITIPLLSPEIKPETIYIEKQNDEKLIINLTTEADKQSNSMSIQPMTMNSTIQTADPPKIKEDENTDHSSDFLADIIRQIISTSPSTHLPSIESITDKSIKDFLTEITEDNNEIEQKPIFNNESKCLSSNIQTEIIHEIPITPTVEHKTETTLTSNSLIEIVHQILSSPIQSSSKINEYPLSITNINSSIQDIIPESYHANISFINNNDIEQIDEKKIQPDFTKIYFELQEQHRIQPILQDKQIEEKQEESNVILTNYIQHFNSLSLMSNLPSREYHQVFGASDEIVNTIDDVTFSIDQTLQLNVLDEVKSIIFDSNETSQSIEIIKELDFRYSLLFNRIDILMKPLLNLSSSSFITENESIPSKIQEENNNHRHLHECYDILIDHINKLDEAINSNLVFDSNTSSNQQAVEKIIEEKDSSNVIDVISNNELTSNIADHATSFFITDKIESQIPSKEATLTKSPIVTDEAMIIQHSSKQLETNEDDKQQQLSSTDLFELSKISTENNSRDIESIVKTQQQEYLIKDQKTEISDTSSQSSISNEEEHHDLFDLIIRAISDLDSPDEQNVIAESSSNSPDKLTNDTELSEDLNNDENQQICIKSVDEIDDDGYENSIPKQKQEIQIPKQSLVYSYPWYLRRYEIAPTEFDCHSSTNQSTIVDHKQEIEFEKKSSSNQQLQIINDDYPWYSNHYTIVDAEAKIARLYKQLNLANVQLLSSTEVKIQTELHNEQDKNEDDFHIVQHRKRIPSSTTHEKILSSTNISTKSILSPDIDLEPVVLHGHPNTSIMLPPIVSQTTDTNNKKKYKKKKKTKKEMILFDAPEPILSDVNSQKKEAMQSQRIEEHEKNIDITNTSQIDQILPEIKQEFEQLHAISTTTSDDQKSKILPTSIISIAEELKQIDDKTNDLSMEQQPIDKELIPKSPSSSTKLTKKTIPIKVNASSPEVAEKDEDNEEFQLVHYRKGILSTKRSEKTPSKQTLSSDTDLTTPIIHEHQNLPTSTTAVIPSTSPKKKRNKHKKHKNETILSSSTDWTKVEQQSIDQKTILETEVPSSSIIEKPQIQSKPTVLATIKLPTIRAKPPASSEEEDNEGYQVVRHRKGITSTARSEKTPPPSSSLAKTTNKQNGSRNIDFTSLALHGHHESASRSIPRMTATNETSSNKSKQVPLKQDKKQKSLFNTSPRSASIETYIITTPSADRSFEISKNITQEIKPLQPTLDKHQKPFNNSENETILDDLSSPRQSTTFSINSTDIEKSTLIEEDDDNDGFQVVHYHKHTPSSTISMISKQIALTSTIGKKSTETYAKHDSSTSTTTSAKIIPQIPEKSKKNKENTLSSLTIDADRISLSIEKPTDQIIKSQINEEPVHQTNNAQSLISSTNETAKTTTKKSNEVIIQETQPSISIKSTIDAKDAQIKIPLNKKPTKRRKKKLNTDKKSDNESILTSPITAPDTNTEFNVQGSNLLTAQSSSLHPYTSEILLTNKLKSQQITETIPLSSSNIETLEQSIHFTEETNTKLDLFLPEYIRQQINTDQTTSTSITISSNNIPKKKQRPKMLKKDSEAKTLLTNEFDNTLNTEKSHQFPIETSQFNISTNIDNILSRGFYLWLQESQALSKPKDTNLTHTMQNIIIQPVEIHDNDEDENLWNTSETIKSTYMINVHTEKKIHITNAYFINHPESNSIPSWLINQSNDSKKFDSNNQKDSMNDSSKKSNSYSTNDTQSYSNNTNHQQQTNIPTNNIQQYLTKDFSRQLDNSFDDWACFYQHNNSYQIENDLSTSLECFYTQTFDEDTLLSDTIPIQHSIHYKKQRYGDFLSFNNDTIISESKIQLPSYKFKLSEYFQNWQRQKTTSIEVENDDEIFLSYSNNGLTRRVKP